ncbi:hypothetical protein KH5H1_76010 [Corallococcus caeni]|nr:hypothetical protein KH5H1_76010 [Corallococcus sp. KH5-1]
MTRSPTRARAQASADCTDAVSCDRVSEGDGPLDFVLSQPGRNDRAAPNSAAMGREGRMDMGTGYPGSGFTPSSSEAYKDFLD